VFAPKIFLIFLSRLCETLLTYTPSYIVHENFLDLRFFCILKFPPSEFNTSGVGNTSPEVINPPEFNTSGVVTTPLEAINRPEVNTLGEITIPIKFTISQEM